MNSTTPLSEITKDEAADNIELFAREGRLVQSTFQDTDDDGRRLACLLGSIDPSIESSQDCPAHIMPEWLPELIIFLFDGVRQERIFESGAKFGDALRRGNTDDGVLRRFLVTAVEHAVEYAKLQDGLPDYWPATENACAKVCECLRSGAPQETLEKAADMAEHAVAAAREDRCKRSLEQMHDAACVALAAAEAALEAALLRPASVAAWAVMSARREDEEEYARLFDALIAEMLRTS